MAALTRRRRFLLGIVALVVALVGTAWWLGLIPLRAPYDAAEVSFDGPSDQLLHTVVVPALESPIPSGKSAVWCASFQLAWNRLRDDAAKGPVQLENAQPVADLLNAGAQSEDDLEPGSVYAAAGMAKDGIVGRIQAEMARRFPNVPRPELDVPPDGAAAYAYLAASAKYDYPFFQNDEPFEFTSSNGERTAVRAFGVREKDEYAYHRLREQVQVLYCPPKGFWSGEPISEFILDPCKTSRPYQIVLARVDRKATLAETVAEVERKIEPEKSAHGMQRSRFYPRDRLLVPEIAWRITHRFRELEGKDKQFLNPPLRGLHLGAAILTIHFRLDRSGAELASESKMYVKPGASLFHFDRPFLVLLKKRDGKHPFFVMWVDNAELLAK